MAVSPLPGINLLSLQVTCDGVALANDVLLVSAHVRRAFGSVASARLELLSGDMIADPWALADADTFKPGVRVRIAAGYGGSLATLFEGEVARLGVRSAGGQASRLVVDCRDQAARMMLGRKTTQHLQLTDGQLIGQLAQASGLAFDVETTATEHPTIEQHDCTDWALALARAELAGLLVLTLDGTLVARAPQTSAAAVFKLAWGADLIEWQANISAHNPLHAAPTADWARALIRGRMKFQGSALAVPGKIVNVAGVGQRFSGSVFLTAVEHELANGNWATQARFGLASELSASRPFLRL